MEKNILKDNICALCREKRISVASLERTLNLGSKTIQRWDRFSPTTDKLVLVADYFDVSIDSLLGRQTTSETEEEILLNTFRSLSNDGKKLALQQMKFFEGIYQK